MVKPQVEFTALPILARCTVVFFGAAGLIASLIAVAYQTDFAPARVLLLAGLAAASARAKVPLYRGSTISFLTCIVMLAVIREGPAVAVLLGVCGVTVQTLFPSRKLILHQLAFNAGMIALTVSVTWWMHHLLTAQLMETISAEMTATVLASFTYFLGNSISVSLIVALSQKMSMIHIWSHHFLYSAPSFMIAGLLSLGLIALFTAPVLLIGITAVSVIAFAYYCSIRRAAQYSES